MLISSNLLRMFYEQEEIDNMSFLDKFLFVIDYIKYNLIENYLLWKEERRNEAN